MTLPNSRSRVVVIGANGQVGAEVCLLMAQTRRVDVIPVTRNRQGSAYLRWMGLPCRHGDIGDESAAPGLVGDADLVLNFALSGAPPAIARKANACIIEHCARFTPTHARLIYYSTQNVYGSANPASLYRWRGHYATEKLACEHDAISAGLRHDRVTWIFRLGHVCGELQGLTARIRDLVNAGPVYLADGGDVASNCVHAPVIVDTALETLQSNESAGIYDLVNMPQWPWRAIYQHEAKVLGVPLEIGSVSRRHRPRPTKILRDLFAGITSGISREAVSEIGRRSLAYLPSEMAARIHAEYLRRRAAREIASMTYRAASHDASDWLPVPGLYPSFMRSTEELLARPEYQLLLKPQPSIGELDLPWARVATS
jgi:nucleoside-diphosphate-sugar epimerase